MSDEKDEVICSPDPHFEPIVNLPPVQTKTLEEDEIELLKLRAKLYRYDSAGEPREWKERGTGEVKLLKHRDSGTCRLLMRRDKTLKICANHYVLPQLELKPNCGSDRAWVWSTPSDFADEEPKPELLAIRFANAENAQKFQEMFDEAKSIMKTKLSGQTGKTADSDASTDSKRTSSEKKTAEKLKECCVKYQNKTEKNAEEEEEDKGDDVKKNEDDKTTDGVAAELNKLKVKDSVEPDSGTISTPAAKKD